MSVYYRSIDKYLANLIEFRSTTLKQNILEIGADSSKYLLNQKNLSLIRSNIKSLPNVEVFSAESIPYPNSYFDLVFMVAVDYLMDNLELALIEIIRVTKLNGLVVIFSYKDSVLNRFGVDVGYIENIYYKIGKNHSYTSEFIDNSYERTRIKSIFFNLLPTTLKRLRSPWIVKKIQVTK
jgi:ubiquinone/menaquinone biosynthesis C-methylase UbiE